jgi:hypothetical protein
MNMHIPWNRCKLYNDTQYTCSTNTVKITYIQVPYSSFKKCEIRSTYTYRLNNILSSSSPQRAQRVRVSFLLFKLSIWYIIPNVKGQCHQIRMALKWGSLKGLSKDIRRLIFKNYWSLPLNYYRHFNFLSWGSKSVQIFHFFLNLIWGCSKWVKICSICFLNVAGAALCRSWTEVEETIIPNLSSKPIYSNSINFQDANRAMIVENLGN